jgi:hypothetical protein
VVEMVCRVQGLPFVRVVSPTFWPEAFELVIETSDDGTETVHPLVHELFRPHTFSGATSRECASRSRQTGHGTTGAVVCCVTSWIRPPCSSRSTRSGLNAENVSAAARESGLAMPRSTARLPSSNGSRRSIQRVPVIVVERGRTERATAQVSSTLRCASSSRSFDTVKMTTHAMLSFDSSPYIGMGY